MSASEKQSSSITSLGEQRPGLVNGLLELVWPTHCGGCEKPGTLLCERCAQSLVWIDASSACRRCGAPHGRLICTECYTADGPQVFSFSRAVCALEMGPVSGRMTVLYKNGGERRLAAYYAQILKEVIPADWLLWADCLTWVPADKRSLRQRGFDHMRLVAGELSTLCGLPTLAFLRKKPVRDQRQLGRSARFANLAGSFFLLSQRPTLPTSADALPTARNILLIDDVFTTGATLDSASAVLLAGGAWEVRVATPIRVW